MAAAGSSRFAAACGLLRQYMMREQPQQQLGGLDGALRPPPPLAARRSPAAESSPSLRPSAAAGARAPLRRGRTDDAEAPITGQPASSTHGADQNSHTFWKDRDTGTAAIASPRISRALQLIRLRLRSGPALFRRERASVSLRARGLSADLSGSRSDQERVGKFRRRCGRGSSPVTDMSGRNCFLAHTSVRG